MLPHGPDHLLLTDRILGGIREERDERAALACLLDANRELDIEGVGQVVDDHAQDARFCSPKRRGAPMIDVAEIAHRLGHPLPSRIGDERASS
jgi:hypothetical protein